MFAVVPSLPATEVYEAVYEDKPLARRLKQPTYGEVTDLTATPRLLVRLAADRYALITSQDADTMTHIAQGAISIAYVRRTPEGWTTQARWDAFVWTGATGRAAASVSASFRGSGAPRVVVFQDDIHQGAPNEMRWTIALDKDRPRLLGFVNRDLPPEPLEKR